MKRINWVRDILLLICQLTYVPLPRRWYSDTGRLPQAMRFLPLLGLFSGAVVYFSMRLAIVMPPTGGAAVLLGMHLLAGGAFLLRDLMSVASGIAQPAAEELPAERPLFEEDEVIEDNDTEIAAQEKRFRVSRSGLVWGLVWLVGLFLIFCFLLQRQPDEQLAVLIAPVASRFLMAWLIFYFPAHAPARLHRAMTRKHMLTAAVLTVLIVLPFSCPALYISFLPSILGVMLFATYRVHYLQALDEASYGAAAAWAELIFLLSWLAVIRLF